MLQNIITVSRRYRTKYTDESNKVKKVKHSVVLHSESEKEEVKERIARELYRIFEHITDEKIELNTDNVFLKKRRVD